MCIELHNPQFPTVEDQIRHVAIHQLDDKILLGMKDKVLIKYQEDLLFWIYPF